MNFLQQYNLPLLLLWVVLVWLPGGLVFSQTTIDSYTTNQTSLPAPPGASSTSTGGADIIGTRRGIVVNTLSGAGPTTAGVAGGNLSFTVTNTTPDTRGEAVISWDGDTNPNTLDPNGLGSQNLTTSGQNAFRLNIFSAAPGTEIVFDVYADGGNASRGVLILPTVAAPANFDLYFSDFASTLGSGANFASVGAILMTVRGTEVSCSINQILAVATTPTLPVPPQTDQISQDNNSNGKADPGDKIRYKTTIQNTGTGNATGVKLQANPDPRTTLDGMSFRTSPVAVNDGPYACTGNVGITVPAASGVKANDYDDALALATLTVVTAPANGSVTLNNDGSFTYTPNAGYTGNDQFTYEIADATAVAGHTPASADIRATVSITVSNLIWFIDNSSMAAMSDGRRNTPFKSLADFNAGSTAAADVVYIEHTGMDYPGGIVLQNNERLFGEGHSGGANLANVLSFSLAANSLALPAINGTRPIIENAGGNGVTLASDNTVRGVTIHDVTGAKIAGTNFGNLTILNLSMTGSGAALNLTNGNFATATISSLVSTSSVTAIKMNNVTGSLSVAGSGGISGTTGPAIEIIGGSVSLTYNPGIAQASNAALLSVSGGHTGTLNFQSFNLDATNGTGLVFDNADGTYNFNVATNLSGGAAVSIINGSSGTFSFSGGVNIFDPSSTAFSILNSNANVTYNGNINKTSAGFLIDIDNHDAGTVTFQGIPATLSSTGSSSGIRVQNNDGGTVNFSSATKTINTGANNAVTLTSNTGATINFTGGGLAITTTSGTGFDATGGGTVTVQGTGNTITSTTGTALNVASTTIGASGLTFQSISSSGGSATGIILDNTGSGGLTVTGTGTAGSGGTIANKTGSNGSTTTGIGIYLNSCSSVSLTRMQLNNFSNFGIRGFTVNNFTMDNCVVNHSSGKNGDDAATDEGSIYFGAENPGGTNGLTGTVSITNCLIEDGYENNFKIANLSGTLSQLTMTNCTIRDNSNVSPGNNGFEIRAQGTANITADITNSTFTGNRANGIQVSTTSEHTGTVDVEIGVSGVAGSGGTFTSNNIGINIAHGSPGILNFDIHRGTFNSNPGFASPININLAAGGPDGLGVGPMSGSITNNVITNANSGTGPGIRVTTNGTDADGSNVLTILVSNNNISQIGNRGIEMIARDGNSTLNATVTNNTVALTDPLAADAIRIDAGATSADLTKVCLAISGNTATTIAGLNGIRIRNRFAGTTFRIPGYGGAATDPDGTHDAVIAYLSSINPATPEITADHAVGNSGFTAGSPCATPN